MKFLRTVSTRRLLATTASLLIAVLGGTAIALAAGGGGPVPKPRSLAGAIHRALVAKAPTGISAQITFTNNLINSTDVEGTDPILTGASGRLWATKGHLRLELQSGDGDAQIVVDKSSFWVYDPTSDTVYKGSFGATGSAAKASKSPAKGSAGKHGAKAGRDAIPTIAQLQTDLNKLGKRLDLSGATPTDLAGQAAYRVTVSPKHGGGLLGDAELAWDAARGIPLDFAVYASGDSTPVVELKATGVSYGPVPQSDFAISPPSGAKVVQVASAQGTSSPAAKVAASRRAKGSLAAARSAAKVSGVTAVAKRVSFPLVAKRSLAGLPRRSVSLLDWGGSPAALLFYGQNLGGVAVIERKAGKDSSMLPSGSGNGGSGLTLPTVSIDGVSAQELDTELGTALQFTRGGVAYLVVGSVPATAADAVARDL
jgi:outer membrane lipoprotein-sorting protein